MTQIDLCVYGAFRNNLSYILRVAKIALFGAIFVIYPKQIYAEVTTPFYTVEYKTQVLFGDSVLAEGYQGLENYVAQYTNGYLHLTFTSTHGNGGYASYAPFLYVRSGNPVTNPLTTSLYQGLIQNVNMNPGLPSDVYFIDIQFNANGYREIVTRGVNHELVSDDMVFIPGMNKETFIALANHYPSSGSQYSMSFEPMRLVENTPSRIDSFEVSTTTYKVSVHNFIATDDMGANIHFTISDISGVLVYTGEIVQATTTGEFNYTWNYPEVTDQDTTKASNYVFYSDITKDELILKYVSATTSLAASIDGYPGHYNFIADSSEQIQSSYNSIIQTLGTGLSGKLTQIDVQTSNGGYVYYGSRPGVTLFECSDDTYDNFVLQPVGGCTSIFFGYSEELSKGTQSTQSIYVDQEVILDPKKYYFLNTSGHNQLNTIPAYYGSAADVVDGACYQKFSSRVAPCQVVSDLFFYLRGVSKSVQPAITGYSNVLFLPGLEASRLYTEKSVLGLTYEDQLWEPNIKSDVKELYLNSDGTSKNPQIYTRDAISESNVIPGSLGQNIYKTFFSTLDSLADPQLSEDKRMARWESYAYDWRQSVDDIVENGTPYKDGNKSLIATLEALVASSTTGKVTIVAHSNGGLIAKTLLAKLEAMKQTGVSKLIDHIDNLVLVASPQIGTATAIPAVLHGYDQRIAGGVLLNEEYARELGRNMPGAYGLLPSKEYIEHMSVLPIVFKDNTIPSGVTTSFVSTYGSTTDSYPEYKSFLLGQEGRSDPAITATKLPIKLSSTLLNQAESIHQQIDAWVAPAHIRVIEVAGWGLDTVAAFEYYPKLTGCTGGSVGCSSPYTLDAKPIFTVDGDGTVVEPSALYMGEEKYWVDLYKYNESTLIFKKDHKNIIEVPEVINFIKSVLGSNNFNYDLVFRDTKPVDISDRLRISIHSPVSIGGYDSFGNFTGKVCVETEDFCYIKEDIPNSSYLEFGEGKYINVPEENIQKVILQGTGTGTFTYISEKVTSEGQTITSTFTDIPVTTQTQGEVIINTTTQVPELKLDVTGDGTTDFTIVPTVDFDPVLFLQIMKKTVESFDIRQVRKTTLSKRIDGIIRLIQKGKISKAQLKAERFQNVLKVKTVKPLPKKPKPQRLTNADAEVLIGMLETLLNNLEK